MQHTTVTSAPCFRPCPAPAWCRRLGWLGLFLALALPAARAQQQPQRPADSLWLRKAAPALRQAVTPRAAQSYRVQVKDVAAFRQWQQQHLPAARLTGPATGSTILTVHQLPADQLPVLAGSPWVLFVDVASRPAREEVALPNGDLSVNHVAALHRAWPALTGAGFTVSIKEQPFDTTDLDLRGRILENEAFRQPPSQHATTIATLIGGAGNSAPAGRGVARRATLTSSDFAELLPDDDARLQAQGIRVQNHSYGVDAIENYYGLEALAYDAQSRRLPLLLHVFSSGNAGTRTGTTGPYAGLSGWANLTGQFKMSKNTVSVGASSRAGQVEALSSRGPAHDGRVKPELVAFGENGTSEAAALVSGMALLVQQAYQQQHAGALPPAALVKAALINSADDLGRPEVDFEAGYGQSDALGAVATVLENRFFTGLVSQGQGQRFVLPVPAGTSLLKVTLVWHDPEAGANAAQALVHDLDLTLHRTGTSQAWQPWVLSAYPHPDSLRQLPRRRPDRLNNVEQITLANPEAGAYSIEISGYRVPQGPQAFSIAYELVSGLSWRFPTRDDQLLPGRRQRLRWHGGAPGSPATGRLEYRLGSQGDWQLLAASVPLAAGNFEWLTPDTVARAQVRLVAGGQTITSEAFLVAPELSLDIGYNCAEDFMLSWRALPPASAYLVYRLGRQHLELYRQTTDTLLVVSKAAAPGSYFAVAPVFQDLTGQQSYALHYAQHGDLCYVKSFLPRRLVADTVVFDAVLSTTYNVQSLAWQKLTQGSYRTIQTISPVSATQHVLRDPQPTPGRNDYRLLVSTRDGRQIAGPSDFVFYTPGDFVLVYPNPVAAGEDLQVVLAGDQVTSLVLYDSTGRVVTRARELGAIRTLSTEGLKPGLFFLCTQTASGRFVTKRLLIL